MEIVDIDTGKATADKRGIRRDKRDRPYIWVDCWLCEGTGKVPSKKVEGRLNKCQGCKGTGRRETTYSRMTTFIDCLDDKSNLMDWKQRKAVIGFSRSPGLMEAFTELEDPDGTDKQKAMALIERAEVKADADLKALMGDALHDICERINRNEPVGFIPEEFRADIAAYVEALKEAGITVVGVERFVVNDRFKAAGTFDILGLHQGPNDDCLKLKIMDVKTGRIDYGGKGKIPMQLAGYATAVLYDGFAPEREERSPIQHTLEDGTVLDVDQEEGLIIHLPAGEGECSIVPVDISGAVAGLELAQQVRKWRSVNLMGKALAEVKTSTDAAAAA